MSFTPRRMLAVALAASIAAGCGQGSASSNSAPPASNGKASAKTLLAAATATSNTGSARFTMQLSMPTAYGQATMHGTGETTFASPPHLTLNMLVQMPQMGTPVRASERAIGTTIYMKMPFLTADIPGGKPWLKLDLEAAGKTQGMDFGSLMNSGSQNPATILAFLQGVSSNVQNQGTETIDGVQTTHYHATVSPQRMLARLAKKDPKAVSTYRKALSLTGMGDEPVDVWVDGGGLLRRETLHADMPALNGSMDFTMDLSDFGVAVNVTAPPASQTTDLLQLLKRSRSSTGGA
jgi:hypothetical protein